MVNSEKKYELIWNDKKKLNQAKALKDFTVGTFSVKKGDLGPLIEKEKNLSQEGNAWGSNISTIIGNACVSGDSLIVNSFINGNVSIFNSSIVNSTIVTQKKPVNKDEISMDHIKILNSSINDSCILGAGIISESTINLSVIQDKIFPFNYEKIFLSIAKIRSKEDIIITKPNKLIYFYI